MIVIYIPPEETKAEQIGEAIAEGIDALEGQIPVATAWMSTKGLPSQLQKTGTRIPSFAFPEQAAIATARAAAYGRWRERPVGSIRTFDDAAPDEAYAILATALGRRDDGWLSQEEVERLLDCYGLRIARSERAATPEEAVGLRPGSVAGSP
jgi:acetate---CoA ligase (ADP-forming)